MRRTTLTPEELPDTKDVTPERPHLRKVGAMRSTTEHLSLRGFPLYCTSRTTLVSEVTTEPALVVGIPRKCMTSLHRNSRMLERRTFLPSACLRRTQHINYDYFFFYIYVCVRECVFLATSFQM